MPWLVILQYSRRGKATSESARIDGARGTAYLEWMTRLPATTYPRLNSGTAQPAALQQSPCAHASTPKEETKQTTSSTPQETWESNPGFLQTKKTVKLAPPETETVHMP